MSAATLANTNKLVNMQSLPAAFAAMGNYAQFIVYKLVPNPTRIGKTDKLPVDWQTGQLPAKGEGGSAIWTDFTTASVMAQTYGAGYGVGFSFALSDPFWFLDIDNCLMPDNTWSPLAQSICASLAGAAIERSQSGKGLHAFGTGTIPPHLCKNTELGLEFYHEGRFVALTGDGATGDCATDLSAQVAVLVNQFFAPVVSTGVAMSAQVGNAIDDDALIAKMLASKPSAASAFGGKATPAQLWNGDTDALSRTYPDPSGTRPYDASSADAALAAHLHFWTGGDKERMKRLMRRSGLVREKYEREDYLQRTVAKACGSGGAVYAPPALSAADARDGTDTTRPLTEHGNALRLLDLHGEVLRYVFDIKSWIKWDGGSYRWDTSGAYVRSIAGQLPNNIYIEGAGRDLMQSQYFAKWARSSQSAHTIDAAVSLLSSQPAIRLSLSSIDADPMLVGFDNARQVIDLRTGAVRPATPSDYITKSLAPNSIGNSSDAHRWHSFLAQVFDNDAELLDWLHRWCGYLLTGMTSEQIFLFLFGLGANGKSVFAELLRHISSDYARTISSESLTDTKRQSGGASPDLASLIGCRMALSSETEDGCALAESLVKSLTGGDRITARRLYCEPVEFVPAFKLVMLGNHRPIIRGNDYGIWRRVRLIPFTKTFDESQRDPKLLDKLKAESPHILAWMIQGCIEWQRRGLGDVPAVVRSQTAEYRVEQDVIGQWLNECTVADSTTETDTGFLYASYQSWANRLGLKPASAVSLGRRLSERGFALRQSNGKRYRMGLTIGTWVNQCG